MAIVLPCRDRLPVASDAAVVASVMASGLGWQRAKWPGGSADKSGMGNCRCRLLAHLFTSLPQAVDWAQSTD